MDRLQNLGGVPRRPLAGISRRSALRRFGIGSAAAGAAFGLGRKSASAQTSFTAAATEAAARRAVSAVNQALASGDMAVLDAAFAVDYVNQTPRSSPFTGQPYPPDLAGLKTALTDVRTIAPDAVILIDDVVASGDTAAVRATLRGTVAPSAASLPAGADPRLRIGGAAFARFGNGQVVESWLYDEAAQRIVSVGPPAPAQPTEEPTTDGDGAERDVSGFDQVSLEGVGTLLIAQGDAEALTIDAEARVLRRIETVVEGGTLYIRPERGYRTREEIVYNLTVETLSGIAVSGSAQVRAQRLETDSLRVSLSGSSTAAIDEHLAQSLDVEASGSNSATLAGTVDSQTVDFGQTGTYDAANLESRVATVSVEGTARAIVNVSESLDASASGASSIGYYGDPEVSQSTSGVGSVSPA